MLLKISKWVDLTLILLFCLLISLFLVLVYGKDLWLEEKSKSKGFKRVLNNSLITSEDSICKEKILNLQNYKSGKKMGREIVTSYSNNDWLMMSKIKQAYSSCHLIHYSVERTVACLDIISHISENNFQNQSKFTYFKGPWSNHKPSNFRKKLYFSFVGDSRIRQQFSNFLKVIPDYDQMFLIGEPKLHKYHGDVVVDSQVLGLRVSYHWLTVMEEPVMNSLRNWATSDQDEAPHFMLIGIGLHYMVKSNGNDIQHYKQTLNQLGPILQQLSSVSISQIVWLNLYPALNVFNKVDIHSEKIHQYNQATRQILKNYDGIEIWDASNPIAEEYIRSCSISKRQDNPEFISNLKYIDCKDNLHTGSVALLQASQILLNSICNPYLSV